jgi:3'-phosphoadenosine 5'-phosphosulfate sulfotransferase (PAPS reductase)/FAD synthetase
MKVIVTFSGGKDSLASLLWTREHITNNFTTVFCDTGWEHPLTYEYINRIADKLHLDLVTLKSKKYDGMVDLARHQGKWPAPSSRSCTGELKTKPMIDYILDEVRDNTLIVQGIRAAESARRAKMSAQCTYFKYYFEPYGYDRNGKPKKHTYRSKDVRAFRAKYADDLLRPVFDWSAQQVIDYILAAGLEPNPLYKMGYKRLLAVRDDNSAGYPEHIAPEPGANRTDCRIGKRDRFRLFRVREDTFLCNHQRQQEPLHIRCCALCRVAARHGQFVRRRHGDQLHELLRIMRIDGYLRSISSTPQPSESIF